MLEGDTGTLFLAELLLRPSHFAARLSDVLSHGGFDGWLLNVESPLPGGPSDAGPLRDFVAVLNEATGAAVRARGGDHEGSTNGGVSGAGLVLWYDSVVTTGAVEYQNGLTALNRPFFDASDGLFANYWWKGGESQVRVGVSLASLASLSLCSKAHPRADRHRTLSLNETPTPPHPVVSAAGPRVMLPGRPSPLPRPLFRRGRVWAWHFWGRRIWLWQGRQGCLERGCLLGSLRPSLELRVPRRPQRRVIGGGCEAVGWDSGAHGRLPPASPKRGGWECWPQRRWHL